MAEAPNLPCLSKPDTQMAVSHPGGAPRTGERLLWTFGVNEHWLTGEVILGGWHSAAPRMEARCWS
jgi:hypothetical protein